MQTNIREVAEQFEKTEVDLTPEGLENMRNDCLDMLKAILWVLDRAKYLWQGSINGAEKSPDSGNCQAVVQIKNNLAAFGHPKANKMEQAKRINNTWYWELDKIGQ